VIESLGVGMDEHLLASIVGADAQKMFGLLHVRVA
jgi:hypothetical protein